MSVREGFAIVRDLFTFYRKGIGICYDRFVKYLEGRKIHCDSFAIVCDLFTFYRKGIGICCDRFVKYLEGRKIHCDSFAIVCDLFTFYRKGNRIYYIKSQKLHELLEYLYNSFEFCYERNQIV